LAFFTSIKDYHGQLQSGQLTCAEAVAFYLEQIRRQSHLNAFTEVYEQEAVESAIALDAQRRTHNFQLQPLHGVVVALKDVIAYKGKALTAASNILQGFTSVYHATAVEKLLAAGAIVIGSCNCDEFAMGSSNENSAYGAVLNAVDESRVPGGSSGGSAVAVQANMCMLSLGSDTGGSVRQPADFCGVFGLKPTYGRISRYGLIAYASSFDQIGIFGKNVPDVSLVLETIAGPDELDATSADVPVETYSPPVSGKKYRLVYFEQAFSLPGLDGEIRESIQQLIEKLKADGHTVEPVAFDLLNYTVPAYYVLTTAEASSNLGRYDGVRYGAASQNVKVPLTEYVKSTRTAGFGKEVKRRIMLGNFVLSSGYYDAYFTKAQQVRQQIAIQIELIFKQFDGIILPVSPTTAFKRGEKNSDPVAMYLADVYTVLANLAGLPAIAVPLFQHSNGLPFGVQVLAKPFSELSLLRISEMLTSYSQY
jgi:aspartyl-tRNA(Asn)/glutamyl-tRNA(Gln) amidotransferase subunit A